jgi:hypothetical protein
MYSFLVTFLEAVTMNLTLLIIVMLPASMNKQMSLVPFYLSHLSFHHFKFHMMHTFCIIILFIGIHVQHMCAAQHVSASHLVTS